MVTDMFSMFDYDGTVRLHVRTGSQCTAGDVSITDISYDHAGGGRAAAFVVTASRMIGGGIVLAHGGSADGRRFFIEEAVQLARLGFMVLLPATSFPAHGNIEVTASAIRAAVLTQRRGLDVLTSWGGVEPGRLGFFGHSGGAFQGAMLSAVEPRLAAVVLASFGAGTLGRVAAEELRNPDPQGSVANDTRPYLKALERFDPVRYVAVPGHRRLLVQHGREDTEVPLIEAVRVYEAAASPRQWSDYACGHGTDADPDARKHRAEFFATWL